MFTESFAAGLCGREEDAFVCGNFCTKKLEEAVSFLSACDELVDMVGPRSSNEKIVS